MRMIFLVTMLVSLGGCITSSEHHHANQGCSQWIPPSVSAEFLVEHVSIAKVDKFFEDVSDKCLTKEWEKIKAELRASDQIWLFHRPLSDGGFVVVRAGVPGKAIITWVN